MSANDPSGPATPGESQVVVPRGRPFTETREFGAAAVLGVFAVGALIGAAAIILTPPGTRTRHKLSRRFRRLAGRDMTTWEKLRRALDRAAEHRRAARRAAGLATTVDDTIAG